MPVPSIRVVGTGRIDERESAFPQATQLPNGDTLCSFNVGGGAFVTGGTDWARSTDFGATWTVEGTILPTGPGATNALKLSSSSDGSTVYAYGSRFYREAGQGFGEGRNEAVLCRSNDGGRSWSEPRVVPMRWNSRLEVSHGILPLSSGRLLAPAATLPAPGRLGEQVLVAISDDGGETWPRHSVVAQDPERRHGYFEQKLAELAPGRVIATCWTVTLGEVEDREDSYTISNDDGLTWSAPRSTGIRGQTMSATLIDGDRLLVLYNRRYGDQAVMMALVTLKEEVWTVHHEGVMYDAGAFHHRPVGTDSGVDEFAHFEFGFPTAVRLQDGSFLATHWCKEGESTGIRWTRLLVDW